MNGKLAVEICDSELNCCNAGELDSDRDDFNHVLVHVFWGGGIRECQEYELASGNALMVVTHNGIDMWKGDWIRYKICLYLRFKMLFYFSVSSID